jgi:hypothetical protein
MQGLDHTAWRPAAQPQPHALWSAAFPLDEVLLTSASSMASVSSVTSVASASSVAVSSQWPGTQVMGET